MSDLFVFLELQSDSILLLELTEELKEYLKKHSGIFSNIPEKITIVIRVTQPPTSMLSSSAVSSVVLDIDV